MQTIKINNVDVEIKRLKLKEWTRLEPLKKLIDEATSKKDYAGIAKAMQKVIELASITSSSVEWATLPWWDFLTVYNEVIHANTPTLEFPILRGSITKDKKMPWEYDGREWYFWLNLFAKHYGWNLETIENLEVDDAIGAYQEISIDDQMDKEWEWGLSEMAYAYDKSTKKSRFVPLQRPVWMAPIVPKELPVVKMKKSFLPVGNIIDVQAEEIARRENRKKGI